MMIKGLVPTLPEQGKIKIGAKGREIESKSGNKFQPPMRLDHFVITTMARGADENFLIDQDVHAKLGERPKEIPIRLLYDDPSLNFPTRYACYAGRSLWCAGDGETASRVTKEGRPNETVQCPCPRKDPGYKGTDKCKMNGVLSAMIEGAGNLGGVWKFRTTSYNSIVGIMSSLAFLRSITGGVLANIPFKLVVQPKQGTDPTGKPVTVHVVRLLFAGDIAELQRVSHQIALDRATTHVSIQNIENEARLRLSYAPVNAPLPGDDAKDIVEEFYPDQARSEPAKRVEPVVTIDIEEEDSDPAGGVSATIEIPSFPNGKKDYTAFARAFVAALQACTARPEVVALQNANVDQLDECSKSAPKAYGSLCGAISKITNALPDDSAKPQEFVTILDAEGKDAGTHRIGRGAALIAGMIRGKSAAEVIAVCEHNGDALVELREAGIDVQDISDAYDAAQAAPAADAKSTVEALVDEIATFFSLTDIEGWWSAEDRLAGLTDDEAGQIDAAYMAKHAELAK
jgi:Recombination directionality factor-like